MTDDDSPVRWSPKKGNEKGEVHGGEEDRSEGAEKVEKKEPTKTAAARVSKMKRHEKKHT